MRGDQLARRVPAPGEAAWRIVVLSGVPRAHELARAIRAAATFPKPFNGDELIRPVRIPFCGVRLDERLQSGWQRPADAPSVPLGRLPVRPKKLLARTASATTRSTISVATLSKIAASAARRCAARSPSTGAAQHTFR